MLKTGLHKTSKSKNDNILMGHTLNTIPHNYLVKKKTLHSYELISSPEFKNQRHQSNQNLVIFVLILQNIDGNIEIEKHD